MESTTVCPKCGQAVRTKDLKCPSCRGFVRHKTAKEAYGFGLGLFDLIPGIRDLPFFLRFVLALIVVGGVVPIIIFALYRR